MRPSHVDRAPWRLLLVLLGGLLLIMAGAATSTAAARTAAARHPRRAPWAATVAVAAPSPGDVSYATVRVRLTGRERLSLPAGLAGQPNVVSSRIGGLTIRARSAQWRALRETSRVYIVVAAVPGASAERDVALFVLRRRASGRAAGGQITFTVGNARAQGGSFWVHGVNARGYADAFTARNVLSTALANWGRYLLVLRAAQAMRAAMHPHLLATPVAAAARARGRVRGPWTGGQHPDARLLGMYHLLLGALRSPSAYGAFKRSPVVSDFIADELNNPSLAARWRAEVANVPVIVPDRYAALAQEEKRFTHVVSPHITPHTVTITTFTNSAVALAVALADTSLSYLTVEISAGGAEGAVQVYGLGDVSDCAMPACNYGVSGASDTQRKLIELAPRPGSGSIFTGWGGCGGLASSLCWVNLGSTDQAVTAHFAVAPTTQLLTTVVSPAGSATVVAGNYTCSSTCSENPVDGSTVTLTASFPAPGSATAWSGCDSATGNVCTVTMDEARTVTAQATYPLAVTAQSTTAGSGGTVTSQPAGIDCGGLTGDPIPSCSANFDAATTTTLTAAPDANSVLTGWSGCSSIAGNVCTVTMNAAQTVTATFAPITYPLSVTYQPSNETSGYVTSTPAGIECGAVPSGATSTCSANFASGTSVTLQPVLTGGGFDWITCPSSVGYTCTVAMGAAEQVAARFG